MTSAWPVSNTLCLLVLLPVFLGSKVQEYCEREDFEARCPENQLVLIQEALYGRMSRTGRCVKKGPIGCQLDVQAQLHNWCSARPSCSIPVADLVSAGLTPCEDDYRSYLQASYQCVPAIPENRRQCRDVYQIDHSPVYLSSMVVAVQSCGTLQHPITVRAKPGQQLSIRLLDFSGHTLSEDLMTSGQCRSNKVYSVIKDTVALTPSQTLCAGDIGDRAVVNTVGNQVEVRLYTDTDSVYMLEVQATGCADPPLSSSTTVARDGNTARVSCPGSPRVWTIYCSEGRWVGNLNNCTVTEDDTMDSPKASVMQTVTLSEEISILIITMVALFVGVVVLTVGIICLKRYSHQQQQQNQQHHQSGEQGQYWPPPPPEEVGEEVMVYNKSCEESGGPNNEYYRTWQLQHHHNSHHSSAGLTGGGQGVPPQSTDTGKTGGVGGVMMAGGRTTAPSLQHHQQHPEHIYESPQFDRDSVYSGTPGVGGGRAASTLTQSSSSYYDLHHPGVVIQ